MLSFTRIVPDETTLKEAAILSAYYSKARESSSVPVDYTEIRHVKKPNGSKPGFVIYFEQKTLYVTPDEAVVMQVKNITWTLHPYKSLLQQII